MKLTLALSLIIPATARLDSRAHRHLKTGNDGRDGRDPSGVIPSFPGSGPKVATFAPGDFSWGFYAYDFLGAKVRVSNGLTGRALARFNETVVLDNGESLDVKYHSRADGGGVIPKEDGSGYYYVSNSEDGGYPSPEDGAPEFDPDAPRSDFAEYLTGGVYSLEFDNAHNFVGYKQVLELTADNCAGGTTACCTWVTCEEETQWGRCWQVDPEGIIDPEPTAVVDYYGTAEYGNWEAFSWDEETGHGYTTDDDQPPSTPGPYEGVDGWKGAFVRFTPDEVGLACWAKEAKAERWCTLNSGTYDYLKLLPNEGGSNKGTFEWVSDIADANPELYRQSEGIHVEDGILTFVAKTNRQVFMLNLRDMTYEQYATPMPQQPDNIRILNGVLWLCTDGDTPNAMWMWDENGAAKVLYEIDYDTETAGVAFSPDALVMIVSFQEKGTWQFWREDGLPFNAPPASVKYWDQC